MTEDSVDKTQEELVEEMARALGHSGDILEDVLDKMAVLEKKMNCIEDTKRYNVLVEEYNALRKEAVMRRDMLMIQQEAIGIRRNRHLDASYPIPPGKKMKPAHEND